MSGYNHYSKSNNAIAAEHDGRYSMSMAKKIVAGELNITQTEAVKILTALYCGEWHHTSCKYNITKYYDVDQCLWIINKHKEKNIPLKEIIEFEKECQTWNANDREQCFIVMWKWWNAN